MRQKQFFIIAAVVVILLIIVGAYWYYKGPGGAKSITVPTAMRFGNTGVCTGCGACSCVAEATAAPNDTSVVHVKFSTISTVPNTLMMSFSMNELKAHNMSQVQYFQNGGTYTFSVAFALSDPMFSTLKIPGACILPTTPGAVTVVTANTGNNDSVVTCTFTLAPAGTPPPVFANANVVLAPPANAATGTPAPGSPVLASADGAGSTPAAPQGAAISSITMQAAAAPTTAGPSPLPVTMMISNSPGSIAMTFSMAVVQILGMSASFPVPPGGNIPGNYTFAAPYTLTNDICTQLQIPANSTIGMQPCTYMISGDLVTLTVPYAPAAPVAP